MFTSCVSVVVVVITVVVHMMVFLPSSSIVSGDPTASSSSSSSSSVALLSSNSAGNVRKEHVCSSIEIRSHIHRFEQLTNCTVVEGYVRIILIENAEETELQRLSFPKLREITGYLLLYRVYSLRSLTNMFPNLAVIRGKLLFYNYALVIFELPDVEEVGLHGLTRIVRGGVRMEKNAQLCYVDTIDWQRVATSVKVSDNFVLQNKEVDECVNFCPKSDVDGSPLCPVVDVTLGSGEKVRQELCWNARKCQTVCPNCEPSTSCYTTNATGQVETRCCHAQCIGGCYGPLESDCFACVHVFHSGRCLENCPPNTYEFRSRRCLLESECRLQKSWSSSLQKDSFWKMYNGRCIEECPNGFTESTLDRAKCERCQGHCPKVCDGMTVTNIAESQLLKGCTIISGALDIRINGGESVGTELEENLGMIEEITHNLKVVRSFALVSLRFLKSLRLISGIKKHHESYAVYILDNQNLQDIWDFETHPNLTIINGSMFFHFNRKLCLGRIEQFVESVGGKFSKIDPTDISLTSNGDQVACEIESLALQLFNIESTYVLIRWQNFHTKDPRMLVSWIVNYRKANEENITIYSARDACSTDVWKTIDVKPDTEPASPYVAAIVYGLEPFTKYAVYVQTYSIATAKVGAMSNIVYLTTAPDTPSPARDITVDAKYPGELHVSWKEPASPNGNVTHYYVYWQSQSLASEKFDQRNYCIDKLRLPGKSKETVIIPNERNSTNDGKCCSCPKTKEQVKVEEAERRYQIEFENFLHNSLYRKLSSLDSSGILLNTVRKKRSVSSREKPLRSSRKKRYSLNQSDIENFAKRNPEVYKSLLQNNSELPNATTANGGPFDGGPDFNPVETHEAAIVYGKTEIILTNLKHFQEYSIEVIACHEYLSGVVDKLCSNRAIISGRTLPNASADAIDERNITVTNGTSEVGATNVVFTWKEPFSPNGLVVLYEIELVKVDVPNYKPDVLCIPHQHYRQAKGSYEAQGIKPGSWTFRLRATSLAGTGPWTELMAFYVASIDVAQTLSLSLIVGVVMAMFASIFIVSGIVAVVVKRKFNSRLTESSLHIVTYNPNYTIPEKEYVQDDWEVPREKIEIIRELGQGSFGMVYEGIATDLMEGEPRIRVAIKTVNESASIHDRYSFLNEASIMKAFSSYHVVKLLGVVSQGQPVLVIMELMSNGDLKTFLRMRRPEEGSGVEAPTLNKLLEWAGEIADGMSYLTSIKYVHRDLAARNCMVSAELVVKIGDFGMTRDIYASDYYRKGTKGLLPVRWMAPESLRDGIFSSHSDIWSYGVVLWEMATLAAQPYQGLSNEQVLHYVIDGSTMERPEGCPDRLYDLMLNCWQFNPNHRPTFDDIIYDLSPNLPDSFRNNSFYYAADDDDDDDYTSADSNAADDVRRDMIGCDDDIDDSDLIHSKTPLHPDKSSELDVSPVTPDPPPPGKAGMLTNSRGFLMPVRVAVSASVLPSPLSCRRASGSSSVVSEKTSLSDLDLRDGPVKRVVAAAKQPQPPPPPPYQRDPSTVETTNDDLSSPNVDHSPAVNHRSSSSLGVNRADSQPDVVRGGLVTVMDSSSSSGKRSSNHSHKNGLLVNGLVPPSYNCRTPSPLC